MEPQMNADGHGAGMAKINSWLAVLFVPCSALFIALFRVLIVLRIRSSTSASTSRRDGGAKSCSGGSGPSSLAIVADGREELRRGSCGEGAPQAGSSSRRR
jgi:hypothetical protein